MKTAGKIAVVLFGLIGFLFLWIAGTAIAEMVTE